MLQLIAICFHFPLFWELVCVCVCVCVCVNVCVSHSVVSDSLQAHALQHARLRCPSLSPRAFSDSCPLIRWCHPIISSSAAPFSFCLWWTIVAITMIYEGNKLPSILPTCVYLLAKELIPVNRQKNILSMSAPFLKLNQNKRIFTCVCSSSPCSDDQVSNVTFRHHIFHRNLIPLTL